MNAVLAIPDRLTAARDVDRARVHVDEVLRRRTEGIGSDEDVLVAADRLRVAIAVLDQFPPMRPVSVSRRPQTYRLEQLERGTVRITRPHRPAIWRPDWRGALEKVLIEIAGADRAADLRHDFVRDFSPADGHVRVDITVERVQRWAQAHE